MAVNLSATQRLKREKHTIALRDDETVLDQRPANIRRKMEYAGGRVVVTDKRVLIEPHGLNIDAHPIEIDLGDLKTVEPFSQMLVIPTGIRLVLEDGDEQRIVVSGRAELIEIIRRAAKL